MITLEEVWDAAVETGQRFASEPQARTDALLVAILLAVTLGLRRRKAAPADRARFSVDVPRGTRVSLGMDDEEGEGDAA